MRKVQQHNLEFDMGRHTFSMGINEFSDLVSKFNFNEPKQSFTF